MLHYLHVSSSHHDNHHQSPSTPPQFASLQWDFHYWDSPYLSSNNYSASIRHIIHNELLLSKKRQRQGRLDLDGFVSETIEIGDVEEAFHKMERGEVLRSVVVVDQGAAS